eukprot:12695543-Alexandrium_andersonii.AAC.1
MTEEGLADAPGSVPARAWLPERRTESRSSVSSFVSAAPGSGWASERGRLPGASSRPTSLGPA